MTTLITSAKETSKLCFLGVFAVRALVSGTRFVL